MGANVFDGTQRSMISMALSSVSLRDLALVQAVAREGSFNSAARAMYISPSGLSHQVQKVEQALGMPLFERGGRRVVPTSNGQRLLGYIEAVLGAAEHLEHAARAGDIAFGSELRLGVPSTLGPYLLPHFIEPFPLRFPDARMQSRPLPLVNRVLKKADRHLRVFFQVFPDCRGSLVGGTVIHNDQFFTYSVRQLHIFYPV